MFTGPPWNSCDTNVAATSRSIIHHPCQNVREFSSMRQTRLSTALTIVYCWSWVFVEVVPMMMMMNLDAKSATLLQLASASFEHLIRQQKQRQMTYLKWHVGNVTKVNRLSSVAANSLHLSLLCSRPTIETTTILCLVCWSSQTGNTLNQRTQSLFRQNANSVC